jgi:hypothetical protein
VQRALSRVISGQSIVLNCPPAAATFWPGLFCQVEREAIRRTTNSGDRTCSECRGLGHKVAAQSPYPIQQILFKPCIACGGVLRPKGTIDAVTLA